MPPDAIQALEDSWAPGAEESYPGSKRVPASDADRSGFEAAHGVVLPESCKALYRRVNGMTRPEWERDDNHPLTATFDICEADDGLRIRLNDIHVM